MRKYITLPYEEYTKLKNNKSSKVTDLTKESFDDGSTVGDGHTTEEVSHKDQLFLSKDETPTAKHIKELPEPSHPSPLPSPHVHSAKSHLSHNHPEIHNQKGKGKSKGKVSELTSSSEISNLSTLPLSVVQPHEISRTEPHLDDSPARSPVEQSQEGEIDQNDHLVNIAHRPVTRRKWRRPGHEKKSVSLLSEGAATTLENPGQVGLSYRLENDHLAEKKGYSDIPNALSSDISKDLSSKNREDSVQQQGVKPFEKLDANSEKAASKRVVYPESVADVKSGEWASLWNGLSPRKRLRQVIPPPDSSTHLSKEALMVSQDIEGRQALKEKSKLPIYPSHQGPNQVQDQQTQEQDHIPETSGLQQKKTQVHGLEDPEPELLNLAPSVPLPPPGVPPEKYNKILDQNISEKKDELRKKLHHTSSISNAEKIKEQNSTKLNIYRSNPRPKRSNAGMHSEKWRSEWKS